MKNKVTIILPISRDTYLNRLFASLEFLECDSSFTNIVTIVDGDMNLFLDVRNRTQQSKFNDRLTVQYKSEKQKSDVDIYERRLRIADIHNQLKQYIGDCDFIMGIEDDTLVPAFTLKKFLKNYVDNPYAGFYEGVELGRWSYYYIGAWKVDDIYNPSRIESVMPEDVTEGVSPIDAGGLYCFMTRRETYMNHVFKTFENNSLGPDVDFGIELRKQGFENYLDWHLSCAHLNGDDSIVIGKQEPARAIFEKSRNHWNFKTN